jgi:signal transduction histidine kinase/DNA-binding response OmpR family regulator
MEAQVSDNKKPDDVLTEIIKQVREEAVLASLPCLLLASVVLLDGTRMNNDVMWRFLIGIGLILLTFGLWFVRRSTIFSLWILVVSSILVCLSVTSLSGNSFILSLLIFPIGIANLTTEAKTGAALTGLCSLGLVLVPQSLLAVSKDEKTIALVLIWGVFGMIWLVKRPLLCSAQEALVSFNRSRDMLEQARDSQQKLQMSLKELTETNTQLIRLNKLTQGLRQVAEDERRAKEEFVANVSHELRTPLNMIIGFCEMILNAPAVYGGKIPVTLLSDLEVVLRNSQHLSGLIDDILDMSQIDAGRIGLEKESVLLEEIIEEAITSVRPLYQSKGLYLQINIQSPLPPLYCDRTRIREVLLNLLSNAGRFTDEGGVQVRAWQRDNFVYASVADTGIGISQEEQVRLFRPFQQVDGSIHRRYSGTGLGLSISKSLVELHDGKMWVESEKGKGTTFYFRLPVDPIHLPAGSALRWINPYQPLDYEPRSSSARGEINPRVIVVERGLGLQKILKRYLQNVEIATTETIEEAVQSIEHNPARALVINDGIESQDKLSTSGILPYKLPAIVCSVPGTEQSITELGATAFLVKPVSRNHLLSILHSLPSVKTILIVDDDPEAQRLLKRMLATSRDIYQVLRAMDGSQGLEILHRTKVDVILLDLTMPVMDGFQFLEIKQKDPVIASIPVIIISARDPFGQPVLSNGIYVTRGGGLAALQIVNCIEALMTVLSLPEKPTGSEETAASPG